MLDTDYLVVGTGASGLAFADTLLTETDARITLVDRRGRPGGHWNDAYPFVALHQPSAFYGVDSLELGSGRTDTSGLNAGMAELASGAEVTAYFGRVLTRLLDSGRVDSLPMCEYEGRADDGTHGVRSLLSGRRTQVRARRLVDATHLSPSVPSTHVPGFSVADGVRLVPPNALPGLWATARTAPQPSHFTVLGGGKTAMDTVVWLLQNGAEPDAVTWVVPRDSWLIDRATTQPSEQFWDRSIGGQADQLEAFAAATDLDDLFLRLERCGVLLRVDRDVVPTMFHLATVAPAEVEVLRQVHDVVRLGRVRALTATEVLLERGTLPVREGTVFVDCTASAVEPRPVQPVFAGDTVVLQMLRLPQPTFSAALTAYVEAHHDDEEHKNRLCGTVPFPYRLQDYPAAMVATMWNQYHWGQDQTLRRWVRGTRLDGFGRLVAGADRDDAAKQAVIARIKQHAAPALANLQRLAG